MNGTLENSVVCPEEVKEGELGEMLLVADLEIAHSLADLTHGKWQ